MSLSEISYAYLGYETFKELNCPANQQDSSTLRKRNAKLLLRWVICTLFLALSDSVDLLLSWMPLYYLGKTAAYVIVFLEGKLTRAFGKRFERYLDAFDTDISCGFLWCWFASRSVGPFLSFIRLIRPILKHFHPRHSQEALELYKLYIQDIDFLCNPCSSVPNTPPQEPQSPEIQRPSKKQSGPGKGKSIHTKKMFSWTASVQLMMRKPTKGNPALYSPHKVWYEPESRCFYWQASGDERIESGEVKGMKMQSRASLILVIDLVAGDPKVLRFSDSETLLAWHYELGKALSKT